MSLHLSLLLQKDSEKGIFYINIEFFEELQFLYFFQANNMVTWTLQLMNLMNLF